MPETHGHSKRGAVTPEYRTWRSMINRCYDPKNESYSRYGEWSCPSLNPRYRWEFSV
jgi:hypothetical protein